MVTTYEDTRDDSLAYIDAFEFEKASKRPCLGVLVHFKFRI